MIKTKPTKEDIADAPNRTIPDLIGLGLKVLFCGINPGIYSGAMRLHFAKPGNRFWKVLHAAGFTKRKLDPWEEVELLEAGYGITCFCERTTARADELSREEIIEGGEILVKKIEKYKPKALAVLGLVAYRTAFNEPHAKVGRQDRMIGDTEVWLLPNPSGLNAHYQLDDFAKLFRQLPR